MDRLVFRLYKDIKNFDTITANHCYRVGDLAYEIAVKNNLNKEWSSLIRDAGYLHDYGKIRVGRKIVCSTSRYLTEEERKIMDMHPYWGYESLKNNGIDDRIAKIVLMHHGDKPYVNDIVHKKDVCYPNLEKAMYIMVIADIYDATRFNRTYRSGMDFDSSMAIICQNEHNFNVRDYFKVVNKFREIVNRREDTIHGKGCNNSQ